MTKPALKIYHARVAAALVLTRGMTKKAYVLTPLTPLVNNSKMARNVSTTTNARAINA